MSIKTIGYLIQVSRHEKHLTRSHLAVKMGIAIAVVCSWEDGSIQRNDRQLKLLAKILGFDLKGFDVPVAAIVPLPPSTEKSITG